MTQMDIEAQKHRNVRTTVRNAPISIDYARSEVDTYTGPLLARLQGRSDASKGSFRDDFDEKAAAVQQLFSTILASFEATRQPLSTLSTSLGDRISQIDSYRSMENEDVVYSLSVLKF